MLYVKPHITLRTIVTMSNDLAKTESGVPDWARKASSGASFGNIDPSDLKPPRLKVLAGQSPEVMDGVPGAVPGNFWITILNRNLGREITGTPILLRKSYQIWAPKIPGSGQSGPLATASDGIHWDTPNQTFHVKFLGNPTEYEWRIGKLVTDFGATKWGSSQHDDPKSKPIATLTYNTLWVIDIPGGAPQLCVFTNTRTGIGPTQNFMSTLRAMGADHYYQRYRIVVQRKTGPTGDPYFTYDYQFVGILHDEEEGKAMRGIFESYSKSGFVTDFTDEADETRPRPAASTQSNEDIDSVPF